jgi:hypothetical protein
MSPFSGRSRGGDFLAIGSTKPGLRTGVKRMPLVLCFAALLLLVGCRAEPFVRAPLPVLVDPDPQAIRRQFTQMLPDPFTSDDTVIVQAPFHDDLAVLGVLNVDRKAGTFELYGLNQLGVQFFHVGGDRSSVTIRDAVPPLMAHQEILLSIGRDIQRIYFDPDPGPAAASSISTTQVTFMRKTREGSIEYQFGSQPIVLLQKQLGGCFGATWRVRYYDYRAGDTGKLFPSGIVMDNFQFHYRIIIKNRDWAIQE